LARRVVYRRWKSTHDLERCNDLRDGDIVDSMLCASRLQRSNFGSGRHEVRVMLWVRLKKSLGVLPVPRTRSMRRWLGVERNSLVGMVLVQKQGFRER
jgi:hypothetical protein